MAIDNDEIAGIFQDIVDLLEIEGENPFRIRSYRNAALMLLEIPDSLEQMALDDEADGRKRIESLPGIGKGIAEKIHEIVHTGRCHLRDELLEIFPEGLLDILKISGMGPKKAGLFFRELGVKNVEELERVLKSGRARGLPGMGEKSEAKLLKAISDMRSFSDRFSLTIAYPHVAAIIDELSSVKGVKRAVPAGSFRRAKDTVGDIDILVAATKAEPVIERFRSYSGVREVVSAGGTKSTVILKDGLHADLRVLKPSEFGSALLYFTGSKAHNVALRELAKRKGLKINEYGLFDANSGERLAGRTENSIYKALDLKPIPPEIRENTGEIEAAEIGKLPKLVELKDIRGDLHMHTIESDGAGAIEDMAEAAMALGYEYIAITEHSKATGIANGLDEKRLLKHIERIERVNQKLKRRRENFKVLKGTEVDIHADGSLDYTEHTLKKLDCVVGAVHSGFTQSEKVMTERIVSAIESGLIHILAHPTGRLISSRAPYELDMEQVLRAAAANNVAMELNSYPERLDLKDTHLRMAADMGVLVSINTDAHSPDQMEYIFFGVNTARRAWLTKKDILNTRGLGEIETTLKEA